MAIAPHFLELFKSYAEIDTSRADGANYSAVINLFEPVLSALGFTTTRLAIPVAVAGGPNRTHLIARRQTDAALPTLIIYNHIDVVPATYADAFTFRIEAGYAYARGAADHKGSTIAVLDALNQLQSRNAKLRFNLIFLLTTDEETSQLPQLEYLSKHLHIDPTNTYCYDPDTFAGGITTAHLGIYQCKLVAKGKSVHSGMSHLGVNAVEALLALWPTINNIKSKYAKLLSTATVFPISDQQETARSVMNVNMISGGIAANVVPDTAQLQLDVRFAPELSVHTESAWIKNQLQRAIKKSHANIAIEDGELFEGYACTHPEIDTFESILQSTTGERGQYCVPGSTPVASWTKGLSIPHFGLGVARYDSNMHGLNERCSLHDMAGLSTVLQEYLV